MVSVVKGYVFHFMIVFCSKLQDWFTLLDKILLPLKTALPHFR